MTLHFSDAGPSLPAHFVRRPHLVERLDEAAQGKLTLVSAPPGYGKTSLLAEWAEHHADDPFAWLDRPDLTGGPGVDEPIERLLAELPSTPMATLLIDDLGAHGDPTFRSELDRLIEAAPPSLHVVASARSTSNLPLDDMLSSEDVTVLDGSDLRFTPGDAAQLLRGVSGLSLSDDQVEALVLRTEGWPAGLQLAAIALRNEPDVDAFIEHFAGDDRHVSSYLTQEVIAHVPPQLHRFLVETSILPELDADLCNAVTGRDDASTVIETLQREGLFIQRDRSLRYLRLFREQLRHELQTVQPDLERRLLRRAARWQLEHGRVQAAVNSTIEAEDWDQVEDLIELHARSMFQANEQDVVLRWLDRLPPERRSTRHMLIRRALTHSAGGSFHAAERVLRELDTRPMSARERMVVGFVQAIGVEWHVPPAVALHGAESALSILSSREADEVTDFFVVSADDVRLATVASRARISWYLGHVDDARRAFTAAVEAPEGRYAPYVLGILGSLGVLEAWSGALLAAEAAAKRAIAFASQANVAEHTAGADGYLAVATVLRERNQVGRAALALDEAEARAARTNRAVTLAGIAGERALLHLAGGQPDLGLQTLAAVRASGMPRPPALVDARLRTIEARMLVATGDADRVASLVEGADGDLWTADLAACAVQAAVALGDLETARRHLDAWPDDTELRSRLDRGLWTAVVDNAQGRRRQAVQQMAEVVSLAEPHGYVRLFLDAGDEALRLVRAVFLQRPTEHLREVLEPKPSADAVTVPAHELSEREIQVIRFLPTRLSGGEIASALYVSLNTLKTHLRSIYRKLGVTGRAEAIAAAEELGLL